VPGLLRACIGVAVTAILVVWIVLSYAMMSGAEWAFALTDAMQRSSGLGAWFPTVFIFAVPFTIFTIIGLFSHAGVRRQSGTPKPVEQVWADYLRTRKGKESRLRSDVKN
jgi:acid phosphatase family membrane protein YuiD